MSFIKNDRVLLANAAKNCGWEVVAENGSTIIERGKDRVEIEYSSAGIPRTVRKTINGKTEIITQTYIVMAELLGLLREEPRDE